MHLIFKADRLNRTLFWISIQIVIPLIFMGGCAAPKLSRFEVQRPSRITVPREVQKVFIRTDLVEHENDRLDLKSRVLKALASELNRMGRFEAKVVETLDETAFDPEKDQIAVIQGEIISGGNWTGDASLTLPPALAGWEVASPQQAQGQLLTRRSPLTVGGVMSAEKEI